MAVVRIEIKTRQSLADSGAFGDVGCYQQLDGTAHFVVDPGSPANRAITDIDMAEREGDGLVHFAADIRIVAPENQARGNHRLLFDVPNRGNRLALTTFNGVPRPVNPAAPTDAGNGFLMRHGYTVVWCGWQHDVPAGDGLMRIKVPEALVDGRPVSGAVAGRFPTEQAKPGSTAVRPRAPSLFEQRSRRPGRDPAGARAAMMRHDARSPRQAMVVRPAGSRAGRSRSGPCLPRGGFRAGQDLSRDLHDHGCAGDRAGLVGGARRRRLSAPRQMPDGNPCAGDIRHAYAFGASQSGRYLRQFLYLGLNEDEQERMVFDGVLVHIAGGKRGGDFNQRFGQPSASLHPTMSNAFPFNDTASTDPVTGLQRRPARTACDPAASAQDLFHQLVDRVLAGRCLADPHRRGGHARRFRRPPLRALPLRRYAAFRRHLAADRHQPGRRRSRPAGAQFGRLQPAAARCAGADGPVGDAGRRSLRRADIRVLPMAPP